MINLLFKIFLFIYSYVHTLFGPFHPTAPYTLPSLLPLLPPPCLPGGTCSALFSNFVEKKT
jgi:hypothetical protein